jgi:hypothetical protein
MLPDDTKLFLAQFSKIGCDRFYEFLVDYATSKIMKGDLQDPTPEVELHEYYENFMSLYRQDEDTKYLELAKACRKAANKVYRKMLEANLTEINNNFLNLVK